MFNMLAYAARQWPNELIAFVVICGSSFLRLAVATKANVEVPALSSFCCRVLPLLFRHPLARAQMDKSIGASSLGGGTL